MNPIKEMARFLEWLRTKPVEPEHRCCPTCGRVLSEWFIIKGRMWCAYGCGTVSKWISHRDSDPVNAPLEHEEPFR